MRPGLRRLLAPGSAEALEQRRLASVERPFQRVKQGFGYGNVRYRGLAKNRQWLALLPGNLLMGEPHLA